MGTARRAELVGRRISRRRRLAARALVFPRRSYHLPTASLVRVIARVADHQGCALEYLHSAATDSERAAGERFLWLAMARGHVRRARGLLRRARRAARQPGLGADLGRELGQVGACVAVAERRLRAQHPGADEG